MVGHGFKDHKGKSLPTFEQEVNRHGFEKTVIKSLERLAWIPPSQTQYEAYLLHEAERYIQSHSKSIDLSILVTAEFPFSGIFTAPAFHWFLTWGFDKMVFTKHPSVTHIVLNAFDDKGNSALFYCHKEHFQAGWSFHRSSLMMLMEDSRFLALDFPLIPAYGGGVTPLDLPAKKVESLVKRSRDYKRSSPYLSKVRKSVNSTRHGVSILHMACDNVLVHGAPSASLIRTIRSHPEFQSINHIAEVDNSRGSAVNSKAHYIRKESCVAAALRKPHTEKLERLVEALLEHHPTGDESRDFRLKPGRSLAGMAQDSLEGMKQEKFSGFRARTIAMMAKRAMEVSKRTTNRVLKRPSGVRTVMKTVTKSKVKTRV